MSATISATRSPASRRRQKRDVPIFRHPRTSIWHLRRTIPKDLQRFFPQDTGKSKVELSPLSLGTRDEKTALQQAARPWAEHLALLDRLRQGEADTEGARQFFRGRFDKEFFWSEERAAVWKQRSTALERAVRDQELLIAAADPRISPVAKEAHKWHLERLRTALAREVLRLSRITSDLEALGRNLKEPAIRDPVLADVVSEYLEDTAPQVDPALPQGIAAAERLREIALDEALKAVERALAAIDPATPTVKRTPKQRPNATSRTPDLNLRDYYETVFRSDRGLKLARGEVGLTPSGFEKCAEGVRYFTDLVGDLHIADITPEHLLDFIRDYGRVPKGWMKRKAYRGKSLRELIEIADRDDPSTQRLQPETVNAALYGLRSVFRFAVKQMHLRSNPANGIQAETAKDKDRDPHFTVEDLNSLFKAPIFTGCASPTDERTPGNYKVRDHRFWAHFCMLFTGARVSEIGGILTEQVVTWQDERGGYFEFDWTEGEEGRSLKNATSVRIVPIHRELIRLGFLEYVAEAKAAGHRRLFPEWKPNLRNCGLGITKQEYSSSDWIKRFYRYPEWMAVKRRGLSLKSYRSAWEAATVGTELNERSLRKITGRAQEIESLDRYLPLKMEWKKLQPVVDAVRYDGLDLSHLYPERWAAD